MNILGKRIKSLRNDRRLNQLEFAKILNISNSTLSQYETGQRVPSDDIKIKIADYFNVTTDYLLGVSDNKETSDKTTTIKDETIPEYFDDPEEARKYIEKHQIFRADGFELEDDEILEFANELLQQMKMVSYKYRK